MWNDGTCILFWFAQTLNKSHSKNRVSHVTLLKVMLSGHLILLNKENVFFCRGGGKTSYFNSNIVLYNIKNWKKIIMYCSLSLFRHIIDNFQAIFFKHGCHMPFVYYQTLEVMQFNLLWIAILVEKFLFLDCLEWRQYWSFRLRLLGSDIMQYSKYIGVSEEHAASTLRVEMCNSDALKVKPTCLFKAVCLSTRLHTQSSTPQLEHLLPRKPKVIIT